VGLCGWATSGLTSDLSSHFHTQSELGRQADDGFKRCAAMGLCAVGQQQLDAAAFGL
jgi:hypothetical protein